MHSEGKTAKNKAGTDKKKSSFIPEHTVPYILILIST